MRRPLHRRTNDRDPRLRWQDCPPRPARTSSAISRLRPSLGQRISLALIRLPAAKPKAKIGSIFINPGGPGGPGVQFLLEVGPLLFTEEVRSRFDLVGFDPRGIVRSSPLICFESFEESLSVLPPFAFPVTSEEEALVESSTPSSTPRASDEAAP